MARRSDNSSEMAIAKQPATLHNENIERYSVGKRTLLTLGNQAVNIGKVIYAMVSGTVDKHFISDVLLSRFLVSLTASVIFSIWRRVKAVAYHAMTPMMRGNDYQERK